MDEFLPAIKFPTTLIIVDDNPQFLNNFKLILGGEFKYEVFTSAKAALDFIKQNENALRAMVKKYLSVSIEDEETPKPVVNIDISSLHHLLFDPNRFALSTVVVTDYAMPDMNGLDLCKQLKNRLIKIIMLTGEAGYDLAVSGFNEGDIDQFVLKSEDKFYEKIKEFAVNLETKLFVEMSKNLINMICGESQAVFTDPIFIKFFKKLINKHNIVEYYLLDKSGSYLLVDAQGQVFWLIVKNEEDMQFLYELAEGDKNVPEPIRAALKNKQKLAFFPTKSHEFMSAKDWRLEDANVLKAKHGSYYYSLIEGTNEYYTLNKKKILPYSDYLKG